MNASLPLDPNQAQATQLLSLLDYAEAGIISRTLLSTPSLRVVLFAFAPGQELSEHTSSRRALVQILSGKCSFLFEGSRHTLEQGAFLHMPPGHLHAVKAVDGHCAILLTLHSDASAESSAPATTEAASEANA